jgi:hypothetical protein
MRKRRKTISKGAISKRKGRIEMKSLKGEDGVLPNSSLWIHSSTDCLFSGITKERKSLFFIPTLDKVENKTEGSDYILSFTGTLFIPCNLSLYLVCVDEGENIEEIKNVSWKNEMSGEGRVLKSKIDGKEDNIKIFICVYFGGKGSFGNRTSLHLLRNKREKKEEPPTQSSSPETEDGSDLWWILLVALFALVFVGAGVGMIYFYVGHKKYVERMEEEKMKKNESWMKDGGVEMVEKRYVWNPDVMGGEMGQLSVEIEFEKEKEENCSSSAALVEGKKQEASHVAADEKEKKDEKKEDSKER